MATIILLNKPFNVLCQFLDKEGRATLADYIPSQYKGYYPAGRLDYDSEGLVLLTDNGKLQHQISNPVNKLPKTYWVQVEGQIDTDALSQLESGVHLKDGRTLPAVAKPLAPIKLWDRSPPIRERKDIPTSWLELTIKEGKNRQVRRMTAAVGYPTLRLIRAKIGNWGLDDLASGEHRTEVVHLPQSRSNTARRRRKN